MRGLEEIQLKYRELDGEYERLLKMNVKVQRTGYFEKVTDERALLMWILKEDTPK